ncbi:MAG: conjugal transfer protein TraF [Chloroflexi bacterium]|nr:conjugal transfer protein TraF [Chloroflexota bacterium]
MGLVKMGEPVYQAFLVAEEGLTAGREFSISAILDAGRPAFLIGSDSRSHLTVDGADAAHALIVRRQNAYFIQPRFAGQRVLVNGKAISGPTCLLPGDRVQIGEAALRFEQDEREPEVVTPPVQPPVPKPQPARSVVYYPATSAPAAAAFQPSPAPTVYRPPAAQTGGANLLSLFLGMAVILVIIGVVGYGLVSGTNATAPAGEVSFAYNDGNVTLLMFEAEWCAYCPQQKPIVRALADQYRGDVYVEYVDIDVPANSGLVARFGARAVPLIIIINDQGETIATFRGLTSERNLRAGIDQALATSTGTAASRRG